LSLFNIHLLKNGALKGCAASLNTLFILKSFEVFPVF